MLKIKPGYTNFVQLFTSQQSYQAASLGKSAGLELNQYRVSGKIAHIFQAGAVKRNNTNTHNYEINIYQAKFSGQGTD